LDKKIRANPDRKHLDILLPINSIFIGQFHVEGPQELSQDNSALEVRGTRAEASPRPL
jgi:hypothetical protein